MKKALRIILPIVLAVAVVLSVIWYLFVYDRDFTRDSLLSLARYSESQGNHTVATWFYNLAYSQSGNDDAVAIELAQQYKAGGNYTKAEYTLSNAIKDGGSIDLYVALCRTYVEQDKLLDAVTMLDSITNPEIKFQLDKMRPAAPTAAPGPGFYNQYISVTLNADQGTIYASAEGQYPSITDTSYTQPLPLGDGENKIYAVSISDNGLVSPLSIYGYTIGGVVKEMVFADSAVETAVRTLLGASEEKQLYTNDLWEIKTFTVPEDAKVLSDLANMAFLETLTIDMDSSADLSFLSSLTTLTELKIDGITVSQDVLKSIAAMPALKKLSLTNCMLAGIAPLERATSLDYLDLSNNTIRDLTALSALQSLQELHLAHNAVIDLAPLAALPNLKKIDISYNSIAVLTPIAKCTELIWLNAGYNHITDLGNIGNLSSLTYLSLESNKLIDISAIANCTAITELNISSNSITDISKLSALTEMLYFSFANNKVKELPAFKKSCALVSIDGSYNSISKLDKLGGLEHLNTVNMDYNAKISSVKPLADCYRLIEVNVYGTKVKDVSALTKLSVVVNYKPV